MSRGRQNTNGLKKNLVSDMITEDYVSFETAKLLKEKGFDESNCLHYYKENGNTCINPKSVPDWRLYGWYGKATLQMAMKWLREVHKIEVRVIYDNDKSSWYGACNPMNELSQILLGFNCESNSYEEACESAIRYCLENLI